MASGGEPVTQLSGEALEKAIKELREDPNSRVEAIEELRQKISKVEAEPSDDPELEGIVFERKDSSFLLRFLRAKKFDTSRAESLYVNYYRNRQFYKDIFEDFTVKSCAEVFRTGVISVLEHRLKTGPKVIAVRPSKWDMDAIPAHLMVRSMLLVLEKLIEDEETQVHGFVLFQVFVDVNFMRMVRFSQTDMAQKGTLIKILQDGFPGRLKGLHLIEPPWYVSVILTMVKPFMKEKLRERINMHSGDFSTLHELIPPEHLPEELGGSLPSLDNFSAEKLFAEELSN